MAHVYEVICPNCGQPFRIMKGVTVMELRSGASIPKSRDEDEPDYCPVCHHRMSVNDPDFRDHVRTFMMVD